MTEVIFNCVKYIYDAMGVLIDTIMLGANG